ncbi:MAG: gamma carbonic anhydrase family protein [Thiotrichaceae bacterium]
MSIRSFEEHTPSIHPTAYVDESAVVIGNVSIGENSSVWPLTVIRGDIQCITIGKRTNIQDGSVLHVTHASAFSAPSAPEGYPLSIGDDVTVGHKAVLHGCTVEDRCLIGMGAIILDGAVVETEVMVGAGSLVPPGKILESGYMWLGSPVKRVRKLSDKEREFFLYSTKHYSALANRTNT